MTTGDDSSRVVVGIDGSDTSRTALAQAARQAKFIGASLQVVGVWHLSTTFGWAFPNYGDDLRSAMHRAVTATTTDLLGDPLPDGVHVSVTEGHPATVLCHLAVGADLLVVGSRGHGAVPGSGLGSVSLHCATWAPCPLLLVPAVTAVQSPPLTPGN